MSIIMLTRMRTLYFAITILLVTAGCRQEDPSTEKRAGEVFAKAKEAMHRSDYLESKRLLQEAVRLYDRLGNGAMHAETSLLLGETLVTAAQFDSAFVLFAQARAQYQRVADKSGNRASVLAMAAAHRVRNEEQRASEILTDELRLLEALGDVDGIRQLKWELIPVCRVLGRFELEGRFLQDLLRDYTRLPDSGMLARVHFETGQSALFRKTHTDALKSFSTALSLAQQSRDTILTIQVYQRLAMTYDRLGKQDESSAMFTEGLHRTDLVAGAGGLREEMLMRVGNIYLRQQQFEEAHKFLNASLRAAIASQNKLLEAYAVIQLGHCLSGIGANEPQTHYRAGSDLLQQIGIPWGSAYAQLCLGMYAKSRGEYDKALRHFQEGVANHNSSLITRADDVFLDCEETFYHTYGTSLYDAYIDLLFQVGKSDEAFKAAEAKRSRIFRRALHSLELRTSDSRLNEATTNLARLRSNVLGSERQLANAFVTNSESIALATDIQRLAHQTRTKKAELEDSLALSHPRLGSAFRNTEVTYSQIQQSLHDRTALVVYIPTQRSLQCLIASKSSVSVQVSAVEKDTLKRWMKEYNDLIGMLSEGGKPDKSNSRLTRLRDLSAQLYRVFVRPVTLGASDIDELVVVMPQDMPFIPFQTLRKEGLGGEYVIQQFAIRFLPDADPRWMKRESIGRYPVVVGFGNQGRTSVDVEYEVRDAKAYYKEASLFFGRAATLDQLRQVRGDILHAAFEVQFQTETPGLSMFVLSDRSGYERQHGLGELFSARPFTLVMFSNLSEAPFHPDLPKIFLMNGTSDVIVNLFIPARKAKRFFNEKFYTNLLAGSNTDVAYRNAILEMLGSAEQATPEMWGAFSLW